MQPNSPRAGRPKATQCRHCPATEGLWRGRCRPCCLLYEKNIKRQKLGEPIIPLLLVRGQAPLNRRWERLSESVEPAYVHRDGAHRITICPPTRDAEWEERTAGRLAAVGVGL